MKCSHGATVGQNIIYLKSLIHAEITRFSAISDVSKTNSIISQHQNTKTNKKKSRQKKNENKNQKKTKSKKNKIQKKISLIISHQINHNKKNTKAVAREAAAPTITRCGC